MVSWVLLKLFILPFLFSERPNAENIENEIHAALKPVLEEENDLIVLLKSKHK